MTADPMDIGSSEPDDEGMLPAPVSKPHPKAAPPVDAGSSEPDDEGYTPYGASATLKKLGAGKPYGKN